MQYLPDPPEKGKYYVEREFLFTIVNTLDRRFFIQALAEIGAHRAHKNEEEEKSFVEIDPKLFELIEQHQSRMSGQRLAASKRTMHALTAFHTRRRTPKRPTVLEIQAEMKPVPKLVDEYERDHHELFGEVKQILKAKRRFA